MFALISSEKTQLPPGSVVVATCKQERLGPQTSSFLALII
jgi:hypothetical protein